MGPGKIRKLPGPHITVMLETGIECMVRNCLVTLHGQIDFLKHLVISKKAISLFVEIMLRN